MSKLSCNENMILWRRAATNSLWRHHYIRPVQSMHTQYETSPEEFNTLADFVFGIYTLLNAHWDVARTLARSSCVLSLWTSRLLIRKCLQKFRSRFARRIPSPLPSRFLVRRFSDRASRGTFSLLGTELSRFSRARVRYVRGR